MLNNLPILSFLTFLPLFGAFVILLTCSDDPNNLLGTGEIQDRNTAYVEFQFKNFSYTGAFVSDFNILVLE